MSFADEQMHDNADIEWWGGGGNIKQYRAVSNLVCQSK